jgi:hypothetical protein
MGKIDLMLKGYRLMTGRDPLSHAGPPQTAAELCLAGI